MPTGKAVIFMALILGAAFAGTPGEIAGVHSTCTDGVDNAPQNGDADGADEFCLLYPWEDGGGEKSGTTIGVTVGENGKISGSMRYSSSAFEYWLTNPDQFTAAPCDLALNYYTWPGGTWDDSAQEAGVYLNDPANGCPPPPPVP